MKMSGEEKYELKIIENYFLLPSTTPDYTHPAIYDSWDDPRSQASAKTSPEGRFRDPARRNVSHEIPLTTVDTISSGTTGEDNPQCSLSVELDPGQVKTTTVLEKLEAYVAEIDERMRIEGQRHKRIVTMLTRKHPSGLFQSLWCGAPKSVFPRHESLKKYRHLLLGASHKQALARLQRQKQEVIVLKQMLEQNALRVQQNQMFETVETMLQQDLRYRVIRKQAAWLYLLLKTRQEALYHSKSRQPDCFDRTESRAEMMKRLIEAASWYRLLHQHENPETGVTTKKEPSGDCILDVMSGEDFYNEYYDLMCQGDWWTIAQAHFENLVLRSSSAVGTQVEKLCQEMLYKYTLMRNPDASKEVSIKTHKPSPKSSDIRSWLRIIQKQICSEFQIPEHQATKGLKVFIERTLFPRISFVCFHPDDVPRIQANDKQWRKMKLKLRKNAMKHVQMEQSLIEKIEHNLPQGRSTAKDTVFFVEAIKTFSRMNSIVPCDLLQELMHSIIVLHQEAAQVLGTTRFSVEVFFPILTYVLLHSDLQYVYSQLYLLDNYAITEANVNGEESYYVYCVHAAVEFVRNFDDESIPNTLGKIGAINHSKEIGVIQT